MDPNLWMSHHMAAPQYQNIPTNSNNTAMPNRFIYVKQNFLNIQPPQPPTKVLVNPHFVKKVYVNPQFNPPPKPKIHINPNVLKNLMKTNINLTTEIKPPPPPPEVKTKVITTRNKFIRVPCETPKKPEKTIETITGKKRRLSLRTKYKLIRSTSLDLKSPRASNNSINVINKFKLDKRAQKPTTSAITKPNKRKYVYINRFLSLSVMAKSVLLKQNTNLKRPGFVNINGILYKKSPNSLRKASDISKKSIVSPVKTPKSSKYKLDRKTNRLPVNKYKLDRKLVKSITPNVSRSSSKLSKYKLDRKVRKLSPNKSLELRRSLVKRYKIIRSKKQTAKVSPKQLKKCNIPCPIYRKFGRCKGKENGTCIKIHNPDQIVLCTRFLQGACRDNKCLLSHKVSLEKMPTCKYFLEGLCAKDDCPYLHVKISPKAEICRNFLEGFCKEGAKCDKRHQFLCPDYEKNKSCPKRRCPYPHGNLVRTRKVLNTVAKKCSARKSLVKKSIKKQEAIETCDKLINKRYYNPNSNQNSDNLESSIINEKGSEEICVGTVSRERPKLGVLPTFIPLSKPDV